ncbi:MAG: hypothetical protein WA851_17120, partial [Xanthobacteraceae bacterium]
TNRKTRPDRDQVAPSSIASIANRVGETESLLTNYANDFCNKICQTLTLWRRLFHAKAHLSLIVYECPPFENE